VRFDPGREIHVNPYTTPELCYVRVGVSTLKVGVLGAGSVGCFVGGALAAIGGDVVLVGRARTKAELEESGLTLTDLGGRTTTVPKITVATEPSVLADRDVILCCVKSAQSAEAATQIPPGALVVSLQNGVRNPDTLRAHLGDANVLGGIVGFNVVSKGGGAFRRATSGALVIERSTDPRTKRIGDALAAAGFEVKLVSDIRPLQWSKLIVNLNNAVSALSDLPTAELLLRRGYRKVLAATMAESLRVLRAAAIRPARFGNLPPAVFPHLLRLPTPLFRVAARAQLRIDPEARSSMWEDLAKGRLTEVDYLNGEIVRVAESKGTSAPLNARIVELVHAVEKEGRGSPAMSAEALWREITRTSP
jgi:2-dehydropantoate 2-reductase